MRTVRIALCSAALWIASPAAGDTFGEGQCGKNHYILSSPTCVEVATETGIGIPHSLAVSAAGDIYFTIPNAVLKVNREGVLSRVAGNGTAGYSGDGGPAVEASLNFPETYPDDPDLTPLFAPIAVEASGNVLVGDVANHRIRRIDRAGTISTIAHAAWPNGIAADAAGNVYVGGAYLGLRRIAVDGRISYLTTRPEGGMMAADAAGNVFIAVWGIVRRISATGFELRVAGCFYDAAPGSCTLEDGVPALVADMVAAGIAADLAGNLFISDAAHHCIRKVDAAGIITTVAGTCEPEDASRGFTGDGGPARAARLNRPGGIALGPDGSIYFADSGNHRIRRIDPEGVITTVAGNGAFPRGPDLVPAIAGPQAATAGSTIAISTTIRNVGDVATPPSVARVHLATHGYYYEVIALLAEVSVPAVEGGGTRWLELSLALPHDIAPGRYVLIVDADADGAIAEPREANNAAHWFLRVTQP